MIIFAIWGFITGILSLIFGAFVYFKNRKALINQIFGLLTLSLATWTIPYGFWQMAQVAQNEAGSLFFSKLLMVGTGSLGILVFHWITVFLGLHQKKKEVLVLGYLVVLVSIIACFYNGLVVKELKPILSFPFWPQAGPAFPLVMLQIYIFGAWAVYLLLKNHKTSSGLKREQTRYLIIALILGFGGGAFNIPQWFGIPIMPYPTFLVTFYPFILGYTIIRYRFMDIRLAIGRGAIYFLTLISIGTLGFIFISLNVKLIPSTIQNLINIFGFVIVALLFPLIFNFWQKVAARYFYYGFYSFKEILTNLRERVTRILDLDDLTNQITYTLKESIKLEKVGVLIESKKEKKYFIYTLMGFEREKIDSQFLKDNILQEYFKETKKPLVLEEIPYLLTDPTVSKKRKDKLKIIEERMKTTEVALFLPLFIEEDLIGMIMLGDKLSGAPYSKEDLELFSALSPQITIALNNAILHREIIKRVQDLEKFYKLTVGRELKMIELKKKIKELEKKIKTEE